MQRPLNTPILHEHGRITRFIVDTTWASPFRHGVRTGNRATTMRMRDARRWVFQYRAKAEERAIEEARKHPIRTFLSALHYLLAYVNEANRRLP